ncbi:MAG: hypothetical protein H5T84_03490, partial [Thermoleophilia bacterium]|nr:hypothetical protein [Thermoleophilia bacterium]
NVLALELGLPFSVRRACAVIAQGKTRILDVGLANERRFVLMMGAGIDALTVRNIDLRAKKRFKELAFVSTGLRTGLARAPSVFVVRADDQEYEATFFVAANTRYYGGKFGLLPTADPGDGMLDLLLFRGTSRADMAVFWLGVPTGLHLRHPAVTCLRAQEAELTSLADSSPVWFQTDGELAGQLPAKVRIQPGALRVLVP